MHSPAFDCLLPFADRKLYAEHKLKGGGVPSSEGLQFSYHKVNSEWAAGIQIRCVRCYMATLELSFPRSEDEAEEFLQVFKEITEPLLEKDPVPEHLWDR